MRTTRTWEAQTRTRPARALARCGPRQSPPAALVLYLKAFADRNVFLQSLAGGDGRLTLSSHASAAGLWAMLLCVVAVLTTAWAASCLAGLWLPPRATALYAIRVLGELTYHSGSQEAPCCPIRAARR